MYLIKKKIYGYYGDGWIYITYIDGRRSRGRQIHERKFRPVDENRKYVQTSHKILFSGEDNEHLNCLIKSN